MQEIEDRARVQIELIEQIHSIKILNKEEIARIIAETMGDTRQVLMICTRLNTWIAGIGLRGDLIVPDEVIQYLIKEEYGRKRARILADHGTCPSWKTCPILGGRSFLFRERIERRSRLMAKILAEDQVRKMLGTFS